MKKTDFATEDFPWEEISENDYICKLNDYSFRVEQMDTNHWWWRVYYKEESITDYTREFSSSKMRAVGYCEGVYFGHSLSR